MKSKFNTYWKEYNDIFAIEAVLDLRMNFKLLKCLLQIDLFTFLEKKVMDNSLK